MNLESLYLIATALCMVLGALMSLGAAIGLVRFPDLLTRLHAGTKPQVFGLLLMLLAVALHFRSLALLPLLLLIMLLQMLTIPISGHMMGRSGYRNKHFRKNDLKHDDLRSLVDQAEGN
ncbi:MAG: monovalent cation/H(+) antiporter subunit G [Rothia sp. (in: high G+C Gram-positive bacteria)]|nr:monovalent cation/H(+) antiporter subunit G [Rothia sp. (in: high G+C Gram-positive bacteria)]